MEKETVPLNYSDVLINTFWVNLINQFESTSVHISTPSEKEYNEFFVKYPV